jgi:hypothetical protein
MTGARRLMVLFGCGAVACRALSVRRGVLEVAAAGRPLGCGLMSARGVFVSNRGSLVFLQR